MSPPILRSLVRESVRDALAVLLPVVCSGCGAPDHAVCPACRVALAPEPRLLERAGLHLHTGLEYAGVVAAVLGAFKDGGRTDAAAALAPALQASIRAALEAVLAAAPDDRPLEVCTIPSTPAARRARGYSPVEVLLRRSGIRSSPVLALARDRDDQAGLDAAARQRNAAGGLVARVPLNGRRFLLVDDIVTTGSTLAEAVRALAADGAETAAIAVLAETPRRFPRRAGSSQ